MTSGKSHITPFRKLVLENIDIPKRLDRLVPSGFQRIGSIAILNLPRDLKPYEKGIAELILKSFSYVRTVCSRTGTIKGELRKPSVRVIAGEKNTLTTHKENGCVFRIDVSRVMFSKGNLAERGRLPGIVKDGEIVVDMFAGIGYFTIPIAKLASPKKVYAIEKNPDAFALLSENLVLNNVDDIVEAIQGDCRKMRIKEKADRVIMGYLPGTYKYLDAAFSFLRPSGGVIHFHDTFHERELWSKPEDILRNHAEKNGFIMKRISFRRKVKEYAPRVYHIVVDAEFAKT